MHYMQNCDFSVQGYSPIVSTCVMMKASLHHSSSSFSSCCYRRHLICNNYPTLFLNSLAPDRTPLDYAWPPSLDYPFVKTDLVASQPDATWNAISTSPHPLLIPPEPSLTNPFDTPRCIKSPPPDHPTIPHQNWPISLSSSDIWEPQDQASPRVH